MLISLPPDLDLLLLYQGEVRTMSAMLGDVMLGPVPNKGAFGPLAKMLMEARPETFTDEEATQTSLTILHFMFMSNGVNNHGISYPYRTEAPQ